MTPASVSWLRLVALSLFVVLHPLAKAVTVVAGPDVKVTATAATVSWSTDVETGTRVKFGKLPDQLTARAEGTVTREHQVDLSGLTPATVYHFEFGTAKKPLGSGSFTTAAAGVAVGQNQNAVPPKPAPAKPALKPLPKIETKAATAAPQSRVTWANLDSLADHFNRHGADFHATSADDYAAKAWAFLQRARNVGLPMKWDAVDKTLRVWEPATRTFAAYDRQGRTRTYFRPSNPTYWERQPGISIRAPDLPF